MGLDLSSKFTTASIGLGKAGQRQICTGKTHSLTAADFTRATDLKNRTISINFKDVTTDSSIHHGHNVADAQAGKNFFGQREFLTLGKRFWSEYHLIVTNERTHPLKTPKPNLGPRKIKQ